MGRIPITVMGYRCERCGHEWVSRTGDQDPRVCPKCKSPYWDKRRTQPVMSYEEFRDRIRSVLESAETPMTWTEIRTKAKLPQKFPNNQWVHRMDKDIGLLREKDTHGIIRWIIPAK